jgi:hypothetical protein
VRRSIDETLINGGPAAQEIPIGHRFHTNSKYELLHQLVATRCLFIQVTRFAFADRRAELNHIFSFGGLGGALVGGHDVWSYLVRIVFDQRARDCAVLPAHWHPAMKIAGYDVYEKLSPFSSVPHQGNENACLEGANCE